MVSFIVFRTSARLFVENNTVKSFKENAVSISAVEQSGTCMCKYQINVLKYRVHKSIFVAEYIRKRHQ